jgi:hypothetical protein
MGSEVQKIDTRLVSAEGDLDHLTHYHEHGTWDNVGVTHSKLHRMPKQKQAAAETNKGNWSSSPLVALKFGDYRGGWWNDCV